MDTLADSAVTAQKLNFLTFGLEGDLYRATFNTTINTATDRGGSGFGTNTVNISSLGAKKIIAIDFDSASDFVIWGHMQPTVSSVGVYGYRISAPYNGNIGCTVVVLYTK